jgi:hypothetical protein
MHCFELATRIDLAHPFSGTGRGSDGLERPLDRIEEMANFRPL